ncbi:MAG: hypothetical protein LBU32_26355 [Clostridiales bacterium]|jgi:hypothetical protein|nr:hypothetical protein [Clostridiales bacterium]
MDLVSMEYFEWKNTPGFDDAYSFLTDELSGIKYKIVSVPIPAGYELRQ